MKYTASSVLEDLQPYIGSDVLKRLLANRHICYDIEGHGYLLSFYALSIRQLQRKEQRVAIYLDRESVFCVTKDEQIQQLFSLCTESGDSVRMLFEFFMRLTAEDVDTLEQFEERITNLEDHLLTEHHSNEESSRVIISIRRELLRLKRYYEQLGIVISNLADDETAFFTDEEQKRFLAVSRRMDRLLESVLHLREYITQVREAYQAQIDIDQNNIMRLFTVITAIFLPLTLIVGWYGMNLQMPEYAWPFGYPFVIALSAVILILTFLLFKLKKWF